MLRQAKELRKPNLVSISWYFTALIVGLGLIASLPGYFVQFILIPLNQPYGWAFVLATAINGLVSLVAAGTSYALAVLLFIRKPGDWMAIFVSFFMLVYGLLMAGPIEMLEMFFVGKTGPVSLYAQNLLFFVPFLVLLFSFPSGKFVPAQSRWILLASAILSIQMLWFDYDELRLINTTRSKILYGLLFMLGILAFCAQIYRYLKVSSAIERQQTKVVVYGFGLWLALMILASPLYYYYLNHPEIGWLEVWQKVFSIFWWLGVGTIPVSLTLAIIRSHLWDIDVIIRKTLIYTLLTASLGLVYFGSIIFLQGIFTTIGIPRSPVVIVLSTLAIFALFAPLRRRIQDFIDRRFYRKRYDAERTLAAFSGELRDKVDLDQLSARMLDVVQESVQPESIALWLWIPEEKRQH